MALGCSRLVEASVDQTCLRVEDGGRRADGVEDHIIVEGSTSDHGDQLVYKALVFWTRAACTQDAGVEDLY